MFKKSSPIAAQWVWEWREVVEEARGGGRWSPAGFSRTLPGTEEARPARPALIPRVLLASRPKCWGGAVRGLMARILLEVSGKPSDPDTTTRDFFIIIPQPNVRRSSMFLFKSHHIWVK